MVMSEDMEEEDTMERAEPKEETKEEGALEATTRREDMAEEEKQAMIPPTEDEAARLVVGEISYIRGKTRKAKRSLRKTQSMTITTMNDRAELEEGKQANRQERAAKGRLREVRKRRKHREEYSGRAGNPKGCSRGRTEARGSGRTGQ